MTFKKIMRYDGYKYRLFRVTLTQRDRAGRFVCSEKFTLALVPRVFGYQSNTNDIRIALFGLEFHRTRSYAGVYV